MNIILIESIKHPIGSFIDKVKPQFPRSAIAYGTDRNVSEVIKVTSKAPPISPKWLVVLTIRDPSSDIVKQVTSFGNVVIFVTRSKEEAHSVADKMDVLGISYKVVDNLNPSKESLISYVCEELGVDPEIAQYIIRRCRGSLARISESVAVLKGMPEISRRVVREYIDNSFDVSLYTFFDYVIGADERLSHAKALSVIKKFKFGLDFLIGFVVKRLSNYLLVYDYIMLGELSLENYKEFYSERKAMFTDFNEYSLKAAIESFSVVSYEKLYYLFLLYSREKEAGITSIRFINLLKVSSKEG